MDMSRPLISTISPSFRTKKYLRGFLENVEQQTLFDRLEIVLDHNEPDSEEVGWVREFQERHPGRLKHRIVDPVVPLGTSMNHCIEDASAELVAIWNIDDLRTPDSMERQLRVFLEQPHVDIVYGDWKEVTEFGDRDGWRVDCSGFRAEEFTRSFLLGPFFMFRKELTQSAGMFDEQLVSGADFDLAIRLGVHGQPAQAQGLLGYHLNEGLGASSKPGNKQALEGTVIDLRYGMFDKIDYNHLASAVRYNISQLLMRGEWYDVARFVPDYEVWHDSRAREWIHRGIRRNALRYGFEQLGPLTGSLRRLRLRMEERRRWANQ